MPDPGGDSLPAGAGSLTGGLSSSPSASAAALLRDAVLADPAASMLGRHGPALAVIVTALYAVSVVAFAQLDIAVPFAIVPLVLAALTMPARTGAITALVTYAAVFVAELVVVTPDLNPLEVVELVAFAGVSLALRLVVVRLTRGGDEIRRVAAELDSMRAQVDEARDATERWVGQLEVAQRAAARMAGHPTVPDVARAVADEIRAIVDYDACRVYVLDEPDDLVPVIVAGFNGYETITPEDVRLKVGEGFAGWVAATGRPLLLPDTSADSRGLPIPGVDDWDESMVVVPMQYDDRVTGVIALSKAGLRQFDLADMRILSTVAGQAATAIQSARAMSASAGIAADLRELLDLSSDLTRSLDRRQVADLIAAHFGRAFDLDECDVSHWDRAGDRVVTIGRWPARADEAMGGVYSLAAFPETRRVLQMQTISEIDTEDPDADPAEVELLRRDGQRALLMIALVAKGETIGLVELVGRGPLRVEARRLDLALAMASEAAMALSNAHLYLTARTLADRDPLTGFFNHRYLHERLGEEILRAQRSRGPLSLLMIDLDDFKLVNDTLGHVFGDEVLRWTAGQIRAALRGSDIATRYGGDEFAVILPGTDAAGGHEVAERILAGLRDRPYQAAGRGPVPVGASIGVATFPLDGTTTRALISGADAALYRVKGGGGDGVEGRLRRRVGRGRTGLAARPGDDARPAARA